MYIFCGCPSWFFHGCPVLQICHIVAPTCCFSRINILFQLDSVSPLFPHLVLCPFAFFFPPVLLFSCSFSVSLLVLAIAHPSFKFSYLPSCAVEIFILQACCAISLSVGCPSFWDCVVAPSSGLGWIHGVYAGECPFTLTHYISSIHLSCHSSSDIWPLKRRPLHSLKVLGNQHPVTEQYLRRTKMLNLSLSCTSHYFLFASEMISLILYSHVFLWILIGTYRSTTYKWFVICSLPPNLPVHKQQLCLLKIMKN